MECADLVALLADSSVVWSNRMVPPQPYTHCCSCMLKGVLSAQNSKHQVFGSQLALDTIAFRTEI